MVEFYPILQNCQLFAGIKGSNLKNLLDCLSARQKRFLKNNFVFFAGEKADSVGIVLSGAIHILREDFWGKRKILARIAPGAIFGEAFVCAAVEKLPVSAMAAEESEVMFLSFKRLISTCTIEEQHNADTSPGRTLAGGISPCVYHSRLIKNLTLLLAAKNISLIQKLEHITQHSTREKLLSYLSEQAQLAGKNTFSIPFNREELADYLSVERSAMSAELSKMQDEGIIHYQKNQFKLLKAAV